jgi:signal transduction histidine kinase
MTRDIPFESNLQLNEQERVIALHALDVSIINHDLKSALSPIKICVEMLESHIPGPLNEKQERMITTVHRCADKLEELVKDIVYIYKLELKSLEFSKTKVNVQNLMDDCMNLLKPIIAEKQIELKIVVGICGEIHADENMLKQVIVNLVKNSVDFVPKIDGKIIIKVEKDGTSDLLFIVEDNGEGIKSEDLDKIFDKFYKGNSRQFRKYGGSGLGLTICKGIVEEHGGRMWVDQNLKNGTFFKFTIPLMLS